MPNLRFQSVIRLLCSGSVRRLREGEAFPFRRPYADDEEALSILCQPVVLRVKHLPACAVTGHAEPSELRPQQMFILCEAHTIDVFNDESLWPDLSQRSVVVLIEEVDLVLVIPPATLAVALARVTAD